MLNAEMVCVPLFLICCEPVDLPSSDCLTIYFMQMTVPTENPPAAVFPGAQYVGKAFVDQYFYVLSISPESLYKFYHDSSLLSRPNMHGSMISVTTLKVGALFS